MSVLRLTDHTTRVPPNWDTRVSQIVVVDETRLDGTGPGSPTHNRVVEVGRVGSPRLSPDDVVYQLGSPPSLLQTSNVVGVPKSHPSTVVGRSFFFIKSLPFSF